MVVLHEHEIRKSKKPFDLLMNKQKRNGFMAQLNNIIYDSSMTVIASVIKKEDLSSYYSQPDNPYEIALGFCLERAYKFMKENSQEEKTTHVVVESRGKKEDRDLELEFLRICQGQNYGNDHYPFEIVLVDKKVNSAGLQLADLLARPIGLSVVRPDQDNRAYDLIKSKFRKGPSGKFLGYGLKIFP